MRHAHDGRRGIILSGHHRSAAALLAGRPVLGIVVDGETAGDRQAEARMVIERLFVGERTGLPQLRIATRPDPALPIEPRLLGALAAHVDWIEDHAVAYRAILQGSISSGPQVQAIVEESRAEVVDRLAEAFGFADLVPAQRIALRGWVGFLEGACLDWLVARDICKLHLARLLAASVAGALRAADVDPSAPQA